MTLEQLLQYNPITIQCHDNPDADAIASGFGLYLFFKEHGKDVSLIYSGFNKIQKSNLVLMIDMLEIPIQYIDAVQKEYCSGLLLTVDCQYGEGNVTHFDAQNVAMIDHHNTGRMSDDMCEIRSYIVSCSTVVFDISTKSTAIDLSSGFLSFIFIWQP